MTETAAPQATHSRLEHMPVTFHAILMGLFGLTLALHAAAHHTPWTDALSLIMLWVGIGSFAVISGTYLLKALRFPRAVVAEWHHPVKLAFFPTISISLLLTATAMMTPYPDVARVVWMIGAVAQGVLTLSVINGWISHRAFEVGHLNPAWFIPAVGNVVVPVAGAPLGFEEISWLFFSAGMIFWLVLLVLVFNRLIFHNPLPGKLFPTMVILIAPPAIGFIAYMRLVGALDTFAIMLINIAYVFAALVLFELPKLRKLPFALSWWALTFPVAALSIASFLYGGLRESAFHIALGQGVLIFLALVVGGLILRTGLALARGEICVPE
ncbi:C4-dicarboxylate transporter/malic acid transport protein [Roseibacterium elongatum DSM 19469]|uniref:C4-dicarboxylate transporter/malic acid transport protein n=1 Tax=Roseicyclus elongatus DSM 19469 TaxID=1294273 RepID=W8S4B5_9RHOB|nr:SLAC1 anion channel family protein [Roseibacterium elongatum]AHM05032.1 C4-dicarboxylate transporter/malic acid transport protein [Roseibacterium elongatum DSM 19469]